MDSTENATLWKPRIAQMVSIKQVIADLDQKGLWEHRLPRLAASERDLRTVEQHLGEALDPRYRAFLLHAGGWPAFYQTVDLFGPEELLGNERYRHAQRQLGYIEEEVLVRRGLRREDLLPIAASLVHDQAACCAMRCS